MPAPAAPVADQWVHLTGQAQPGNLHTAAELIRKFARWYGPLDPTVRQALEEEATRLDDTLDRLRIIQRIREAS